MILVNSFELASHRLWALLTPVHEFTNETIQSVNELASLGYYIVMEGLYNVQ